MQTIQNILKIAPSGAVLSDQYGSTTGISLEIMLGTAVSLEFDLREESAADNTVLAMYPLEKLISGAYYCAFDTACKYSDSPLLLQISGITLTSGNGKTVFAVNIPDTAVEKMITALAGRESLQMFCEIGGISPEGKANFAWHFPVTVRNRVFSGNGEATVAGDPEYYTSVQVEAAISRPLIYEYSADAQSWHPDFVSGDKFLRMRHGENGFPSEAMPLPRGEKGDTGAKGDKGDPGSSGLEDVFLSFEETEDANMECYFSPESGKRYIIDVEDFGTTTYLYILGSYTVTDECQIWLRIEETAITNDLFRCNLSSVFNLVNEPDLSSRNLESGYRYIVISIQNNLAVCSEFTLGDENNIWYGEVE